MRADDPGAYVDWSMAVLKYWRAQGVELALFSPLNEPQDQWELSPTLAA